MKRISCKELQRRQRGVALAFLLWMLAALSLMVAGVVSVSVTDVRATGLQLDQIKAEAAAVGAAHLALRDLLSARSEADFNPRSVFQRQYPLGESEVTVRAIPIGGFLSLNLAPAGLLHLLFEHVGQVAPGTAEALAGEIVAMRGGAVPDEEGESRFPAAVPAPFMVVEDLLRVSGMTRTVYDLVRSALHAQSGGVPGVDPLAAQGGALQALAHGDTALVDVVMKRRQEESIMDFAPPPGLSQDFLVTAGGGVYCLEIEVQVASGRRLRQRIWADMGGRTGTAPWRFTRVFPIEVANPATGTSQ